MKSTDRRAFALIDALALLGCLFAGIAIMGSVMGQAANPSAVHPKSIDDAGRLRQIHRSMLVFASDNKDRLPLPGLINRLPDLPSPPGVGNAPGIGPEDESLNTTASLYAAMIAQNYFESKLVISPVERNPRVRVDVDYDYNQYNVVNDSYWDRGFKADLAEESNTSYAHLVLFGERKKLEWRATHNAKFAALSNRGPKDGEADPPSLTCGPHGNWAGNVAFHDNHIEFLSATSSDERTFIAAANGPKPDNFFAVDDGAQGKDMALGFTRLNGKDGFELQWD